MFDCLDTTACTASAATSTNACHTEPRPALTPAQIERRYLGQNWLHVTSHQHQFSLLARVREMALYLDADVTYLADGSLLILGLGLDDTLALSQQFGAQIAIEAGIARRHPQR